MNDNRKNQHTVSKSYLERFTFNGKNLYVFDKILKNVFSSNIKNIATKKYFYDIPKNVIPYGTDNQIIEKKILGYVDTNYKLGIDQILRDIGEHGEFNNNLKTKLSAFIFIQVYRTLHSKNNYKKSIEKELKEDALEYLKNKGKDINSNDFEVKCSDELAKLKLHRLMITPEIIDQVISVLNNFIWVVAYNTTNLPFWTSDNPVTFKKHKNHTYKCPTLYWPSSTEVALPLTPKHILIMLERSNNPQWKNNDCKIILATYDNVIHYNSRYIGHYCRQIYSNTDNFSNWP